jgi:hypothetical protein
MASVQQETVSTNKGGPFNGFMARQTIDGYRNGADVITRSILRRVFNYGPVRVSSPFRAVNNLGDTLGRQNYSCGGPSQTNASKPGYGRLIGHIQSQCDGSGIAPSTYNTKFVSDSSDYIKFKKQTATLANYNDLSMGGANNGAYVPLMRVRRG